MRYGSMGMITVINGEEKSKIPKCTHIYFADADGKIIETKTLKDVDKIYVNNKEN